ncbi:MAG: DUF975 family protein [Clostridiales bacterium]|nr:DUF975 family protein [Clostridiales bacterium]
MRMIPPSKERKKTMLKIIPASEFRRRARMAMKPVMSVLILVALIAALPSLLSSTITLMTGATPDSLLTNTLNRTMQVMEKYGMQSTQTVEDMVIDEETLLAMEADLLAVTDGYMQDVDTFLRQKGPIMAATTLLVLVAGPVLTLGMINAMLHALRRKEFTVSMALSRLNCFFRVLGLQLLVILKTMLWMLPGMALMIAGLFVPAELIPTVMLGGMAGMLVPGIMANYRYAMAVYVMADTPETPILRCIRRSKEIMHRRKGELFCLELSFIGWSLLLSYVQAMLNGFGPVIGLALGMFASLFLTVYTNCAKTAFYQEYGVGPLPAPQVQAEQEPEADELN